MKKLYEHGFILVSCLTLLTLAGCTSLADKNVILDTSVQGAKITTGADPSSSSFIPSGSFGWGWNLLITFRADKNGTLEYEKESGSFFGAIFGKTVKDTIKVRITANEGKIKVTTKTNTDKEVTTEVGNGKVVVKADDGIVVSTPAIQEDK